MAELNCWHATFLLGCLDAIASEYESTVGPDWRKELQTKLEPELVETVEIKSL